MTEHSASDPSRAATRLKLWVSAALTALLVACSSGLEGTYEDPLGLTRYTFQADGKVRLQAMGSEVEMSYEKEGDKVKIGPTDGRIVLTVLEDGSLQGPMGLKLTLQRP